MFTAFKINRFRKKIRDLEDKTVYAKREGDYMILMDIHTKLIALSSDIRILREKNPNDERFRNLFERALEATEETAIAIWH